MVADEQNLLSSYIRSDLSSAYNHGADTTDENLRKLAHFYRAFAYVRQSNLFLVFDQVKALPSSNPHGQYRKQLRWHYPVRPTVAANTVLVEKGDSRLHMVMLSPDKATIRAVDEMANPDPCDGSVTPCTPYGMDSGTWRIEVEDPDNPLFIPFLTVLQSGPMSMAAPVAVKLVTNEGAMSGARIATADGHVAVVLFNAEDAQLQTPVVSVSYAVPSPSAASHMLCGMKTSAKYAVTMAGNTVTVAESASGSFVSSPAGVLQFGTLPNAVDPAGAAVSATLELGPNYPNPMRGTGAFEYTLPRAARVVIELFNALGSKVKTLAGEVKDAGSYRLEWRSDNLPAGVYLCRLRAADQMSTRLITITR